MKLYDFIGAPNPRRMRVFIAEKGIEIPREQVDLSVNAQFDAGFAEINPYKSVPVLELDDGTRLVKCEGIARYLEAEYPDPPLMGRNPVEVGLVADMNAAIIEHGYAAVVDAFRNSAPYMKGRASLAPWPAEQIPELAARGLEGIRYFMDMLDSHLEGKEFVAADHFTWADINGIVWIDFIKIVKVTIPDSCPNVKRWYEALSARKSFQA